MLFNKNLGQNFLYDKSFLNKIEKLIDITGKNIIEVGPGSGQLTSVLLKKKPKTLTLIEKDYRFITELKEKYNVILDDCLTSNLNSDLVISNLPYNISNDFLLKMYFEEFSDECYLMLQQEFAEKLISNNKMSYIGVLTNFVFDPKILLTIPPKAFFPKPKVFSNFVYFKKHNRFDFSNKNKQKMLDILKILFKNSNKKIQNLLKNEDLKYINNKYLDNRSNSLDLKDFFKLFV
ncbi:MAG: ribosomal RNA small subunit methyltransferase A [Bacteroidota bacterium]